MPIQTRATLKGYFVKGSIPTADNFADLIDSTITQQDDGILTSATAPVSIKAVGAEEGLINFYRIVGDTLETTWQIKQKPTGTAGGLSIGTPTATRLFIDAAGNVGIGTTNPLAKVHVIGDIAMRWGNNSQLNGDQGGSIELGGYVDTAGIGTPYIDFHFKNKIEDFNTRIINDADGQLTVDAPTFHTTKNAVVGGILTCGGGIPQQVWQSVSFQNNWHNYGVGYNDAGYFKDSMGIVHLKGLVAGVGAAAIFNTTIFTLPEGYRPGARELFVCSTNPNVAGRVDVLPDGQVQVVQGNSGWLSLDGLTFRIGSWRFIPIILEPFHV
jgi:hypothetical protein